MGRKSLADELADLANPAPEADPEEDVFGAGPVLLESEDEEAEGGTAAKRRAKEKGLILRGDIELNGAEYSGKRTTRAEMFGDGSEEESGSGSDGEEEEEADEEDDDDDIVDRGDMDVKTAGATQSDSVGGSDDIEDSPEIGVKGNGEGGGDDEEVAGDYGQREGSMAANDRRGGDFFGSQLETLEEEESKLREAMAKRAASDASKGKAVGCQQRLHKVFVEYRILLQQVLEGANRMPQPDCLERAVEADASVSAGMTSLAASAVETLSSLRELQAGIAASNPAIGDVSTSAVPHGGGDEVKGRDSGRAEREWEQLDTVWQAVSPFITSSIDRWHRKTMLGSGGAALRSKLKALNQTPSQHVASMMEEPSKWVARSRLPVGSVLRVGAGESVAEAEHSDDELDEETFDDADFYQVLLKEFLEGEVGGSTYSATTRKKRKKAVDVRASKGRKLRYDVHEKLVNFMTPVEHAVPSFASQVFSNLFGRHANNNPERLMA